VSPIIVTVILDFDIDQNYEGTKSFFSL